MLFNNSEILLGMSCYILETAAVLHRSGCTTYVNLPIFGSALTWRYEITFRPE